MKYIAFLLVLLTGCSQPVDQNLIQDVKKAAPALPNEVWLSHEHIFVDFIGADKTQHATWNHQLIIEEILPYLKELEAYNVKYFVDATPSYLGKDPLLLEKIADITGLKIITNTGFYGAVKNKFIPTNMFSASAVKMSELWIDEFENGIDGTSIKPGFIKISVDNTNPLDSIDQKLVEAAAMTHLSTGLKIASHTGAAKGLWPQLNILKSYEVSPEAFIWVHAQNEKDNEAYLKAAKMGCWISLDGIGSDDQIEKHLDKLIFAKQNDMLNNILISHDSGWFDPQKETQNVRPFTNIFTKLIPALKAKGFTDAEINLLISINPSKAFSISIKKI